MTCIKTYPCAVVMSREFSYRDQNHLIGIDLLSETASSAFGKPELASVGLDLA